MSRIRWLGVALAGALCAVALAANVAHAGGGGACRGASVTEAINTTVHMEGNCFAPTVLHVQVGDTVTWTNFDPVAHTVSGANVAWGDYTQVQQGRSVSHQFTEAGAYPYYCFLHPGMIGAIVVGDGTAAGTTARTQDALAAVEPAASGHGSVAAVAASGGVVLALAAGALVYATRRRNGQ